MQGTRVAARYAKSFIDLTMEQGVLEQAYADMKTISSVCESNHDFVTFLKSPIINTDKKQAVLKEIFAGKLNKVTDAYIHLITNKKREIFLLEIACEFIKQYKENKKMAEHCDHIIINETGTRKGIPVLSIIGSLNDDYEGGEFIMFQDEEIKLKQGDLMIFPSVFLYPHRVEPVTKGVRNTFVSWAW
jgi:predicted 2-oxoglutarate/Fe(II)-dependent dioxygenase YbiX